MAQTIVILVVLGILIMIDNKVLEQNRLTNTCSRRYSDHDRFFKIRNEFDFLFFRYIASLWLTYSLTHSITLPSRSENTEPVSTILYAYSIQALPFSVRPCLRGWCGEKVLPMTKHNSFLLPYSWNKHFFIQFLVWEYMYVWPMDIWTHTDWKVINRE